MSALFRRRCFRHPAREAAARCPGCARTFCRECVTEHDERVLCAACLARSASGREAHGGRRVLRRVAQGSAGLAGLLLAWLFFLLLGYTFLLVSDSLREAPARAAAGGEP